MKLIKNRLDFECQTGNERRIGDKTCGHMVMDAEVEPRQLARPTHVFLVGLTYVGLYNKIPGYAVNNQI